MHGSANVAEEYLQSYATGLDVFGAGAVGLGVIWTATDGEEHGAEEANDFFAGWLRPQENHCLAVPRDVVRALPERLQELLGYNIYPPFVGYVDGRHPRKVL